MLILFLCNRLQAYLPDTAIPQFVCKNTQKKSLYLIIYAKKYLSLQKNRNRGECWRKEEARMAFRRDAYKLLKTNIYLQFSDISRIFAPNI